MAINLCDHPFNNLIINLIFICLLNNIRITKTRFSQFERPTMIGTEVIRILLYHNLYISLLFFIHLVTKYKVQYILISVKLFSIDH